MVLLGSELWSWIRSGADVGPKSRESGGGDQV